MVQGSVWKLTNPCCSALHFQYSSKVLTNLTITISQSEMCYDANLFFYNQMKKLYQEKEDSKTGKIAIEKIEENFRPHTWPMFVGLYPEAGNTLKKLEKLVFDKMKL